MPRMNSLASTMWPGALYTDDDNANNDADADADNDTTAWLH